METPMWREVGLEFQATEDWSMYFDNLILVY